MNKLTTALHFEMAKKDGISDREFAQTLKVLKKKLVKKSTKINQWRKTAEEFMEFIHNVNDNEKERSQIIIELFEDHQNYLAFEAPPFLSIPILNRICLAYRDLKRMNEAVILRKKWLKFILNQVKTQTPLVVQECFDYPDIFITTEFSEFVEFSDLGYESRICRKLLKICVQKDYYFEFLHILRACGQLSMLTRDYKSALKYYRVYIKHTRGLKVSDEGEKLYQVGLCHLQLGNFDLASKTLLKCLQYDFTEFSREEMRAKLKVAHILFSKGKDAQAIKLYGEALGFFKEINLKKTNGAINGQEMFACVWRMISKYDIETSLANLKKYFARDEKEILDPKMVKHLTTQFEVLKTVKVNDDLPDILDAFEMSLFLNCRGNYTNRKFELPWIPDFFKLRRQVNEQFESRQYFVLQDMKTLYSFQRDDNELLNIYEFMIFKLHMFAEAIDFIGSTIGNISQSTSSTYLGFCYFYQKDYVQAHEMFQKALRGTNLVKINALFYLGLSQYEFGDYQSALHCLQKICIIIHIHFVQFH